MATPIPENTARFSMDDIVSATGASVTGEQKAPVVGVTSDSRRVRPGNLFVALSGERFDGHAFIEQAVANGASAVLLDRQVPLPEGIAAYRVDSTLAALGSLARWHKRRLGAKLIAVAGSAGKTTTKRAVARGLELLAPGQVHESAGNLNNAIGVPFVLLGLTREHRFGVIEIGTNRPGEVRELARLVEPHIGILTLIGLEHSEGLGDLDSIEREEGSLFDSVPESGCIVFNADDSRVCRQAGAAAAQVKLGYGRDSQAHYRLLERALSSPWGARLRIQRGDGTQAELTSTLLGEAGALATLAAFATAELCAGGPLDPSRFSERLGTDSVHSDGRLSLLELGDGSVVLDDSYNSNPASVRSSLSVAKEIAELRRSRLLLVLGEMRELGPLSQAEHQGLAADVVETGAAYLVAVAGDARYLVEPARAAGMPAEFAEDSLQALSLTLARAEPGDVILVKGSRGVRVERVVEGLVDAKGRAA